MIVVTQYIRLTCLFKCSSISLLFASCFKEPFSTNVNLNLIIFSLSIIACSTLSKVGISLHSINTLNEGLKVIVFLYNALVVIESLPVIVLIKLLLSLIYRPTSLIGSLSNSILVPLALTNEQLMPFLIFVVSKSGSAIVA